MQWVKNLGSILGIVRIVVALAAPLKELVEAVEQYGHGQEKKQAVKDMVRAAIQAAEVFGPDLPEDKILEAVDSMIELWVAFEHVVGRFKHSGKEKAPDPTPA